MKNDTFCLYVYTASTMSEPNTAAQDKGSADGGVKKNSQDKAADTAAMASPSTHSRAAHRRTTRPAAGSFVAQSSFLKEHVKFMRKRVKNYRIPKKVEDALQKIYEEELRKKQQR